MICLVNMLMFTSFYFLLPTLPLYIADVLKGDESDIGYNIGVLTLTAVLVRPLAGFMLDSVGRKKTLIIALAAFTLAMAAYNLAASLAVLFLLRVLHGFFWGFTTTGASTIAADVVPQSRRGEGLGYYGLSNTLAMAIGPSLGLFVLNSAGYTPLFTACFAVAAAGLAAVLGVSYQESTHKVKLSLESFFEPKVLSLSLIMFFVAMVYGSIVSFITLYGTALGVKNAGTYFLVYALTLLVVRPYAGRVFDQKGPRRIMAAGFIAIALAFVLLFLARENTLFIISAVALGTGFGIVNPTVMAMAINRVAPYRRGAANGTVFSALDLGIGLGSILLGFLSKKVGLSYMYLACGFIALIPMVLFYLKDAGEYRAEKN
ncbi:MAG: MFS transporter [Peptococcaceae bacterium]|nr:MFS transporter [Peptococcaceae bacterium]